MADESYKCNELMSYKKRSKSYLTEILMAQIERAIRFEESKHQLILNENSFITQPLLIIANLFQIVATLLNGHQL